MTHAPTPRELLHRLVDALDLAREVALEMADSHGHGPASSNQTPHRPDAGKPGETQVNPSKSASNEQMFPLTDDEEVETIVAMERWRMNRDTHRAKRLTAGVLGAIVEAHAEERPHIAVAAIRFGVRTLRAQPVAWLQTIVAEAHAAANGRPDDDFF